MANDTDETILDQFCAKLDLNDATKTALRGADTTDLLVLEMTLGALFSDADIPSVVRTMKIGTSSESLGETLARGEVEPVIAHLDSQLGGSFRLQLPTFAIRAGSHFAFSEGAGRRLRPAPQ